MKNIIITLILLFNTILSFGQVVFEKGYYIDENNRRTECFIKNHDWRNNPTNFEYKTEKNDTVKNNSILLVKEFGMYGDSRYVRATVNIDRSYTEIYRMSTQKSPLWSKEQLFLKVLLAGKASLYYYFDNETAKFFYSKTDTPIQQLIYKEYKTDDGIINTNDSFRQQLWNDIKCENTTIKSLENLNFYQKDLENQFKVYNKCNGDTSFINYSHIQKRDFINFRITPGINYSSLVFNNSYLNENIKFDNNLSFRIGIEAEYILPFNKNKWGIIIEPTYQNYTTKKMIPTYNYTANVNYGFVEFPIGLRYYYFLNNYLKVYLNGFYIPGSTINLISSANFNDLSKKEIAPDQCFAIGGAVEYKNLNLEVRYYSNKNLLSSYVSYSTDYSRVAVILGYKFIKIKQKKKM
jgi:hypothetical protein